MKKILFALFFMTIFSNSFGDILLGKFLVVQGIVRTETPLTMENVIRELIKNDIQHIDVVVRQIMWETGHLKSRRAVKDHNLFGFQTGKGGLKFNKWEDSVKYYKLWQTKKFKGGDYYSFLTRVGYAEDVDYVKKLQSLSTEKFKTFYT